MSSFRCAGSECSKELKTQIKSEQARAEEIKEYEQYVQTDDYMKEIAEDKLNLVDPNEIVFKPIK